MEFLHELPEHRLVEKLAKPQSIFYKQFGIPQPFCWVGLRLPLPELIPGMEGDVDLCWGPLPRQWKANATEETKWHVARYGPCIREFFDETEWVWPPTMNKIEAFEFKTHPAHVDGRVRRKGNQASPRSSGDQQAEILCRAGFDRVTLIDLMAAEPADVPGHNPWFSGAAIAGHGASILEKEIRRREEAPYGRVTAEWSQVSWKDPELAGSFGVPTSFRGSPPNHLLRNEQVRKNREIMISSLHAIFSGFDCSGVPFSLFVRHCPRCRAFYMAESPDRPHCE